MSLLGYPSVFLNQQYSYLSLEQYKKKSVLNKSKNFLKKQNFKKWLSITIFGHFAKYIVRQNGYKMVDFGNEVLINQLDD